MTDLTLYHNPRCSKSRGALELLEARGLSPTVVRYLETPPTAAQLTDLLAKLKISARQLLRTGEDEYKTLNLADSSLSDAQLIDAMAAHPKLIERRHSWPSAAKPKVAAEPATACSARCNSVNGSRRGPSLSQRPLACVIACIRAGTPAAYFSFRARKRARKSGSIKVAIAILA